jgi:hypothetical protein
MPGHSSSGRCFGSTRTSMLRATLGCLLMKPARSRVAAHRVWSERDCEPPRSRPRQTGDVRLPRVQAFLRDPAGWQRLRARKEANGQAHANQTSGDQGAAHGDPPRWDRWARQMACPSPARLDGLLCCADERLSDLSISASHDRTLARRPHASQPAATIDVDPYEDDC